MKICLIGKYPPIEGGVSAQNYWLAKGLGKSGHEIYIVTNAYEVEDDYRIKLSTEDIEMYQPEGVSVFNTNPFSNPKYIPFSNPYVTKLASVAIKIIKDFDIDLIYAHYLEPYCIAGYIAKSITQKPLVIKHAGSDIARLFKDNVLHHLYKEIIKQADMIISSGENAYKFWEQIGIKKEKVYTNISYSLDEQFFSPNIKSVKWEKHLNNYDNTPILLSYGKIGETKGSYDLVNIIGQLKNKCHLIYITSQGGRQKILNIAEENDVADRIHFLPFVSNTAIPKFIKGSTVTCFLERNFPIKIHGPVIPREVMAVGKCLVVSKEIFDKQFFKDKLRPNTNIVAIDPMNHKESAKTIDNLLNNEGLINSIGYNGYKIFKEINDYGKFIDSYIFAFSSILK